jgi:hypothetical protein
MRHEVLSRSTDLLQVHEQLLELTIHTQQQSATQRLIHVVLPISCFIILSSTWLCTYQMRYDAYVALTTRCQLSAFGVICCVVEEWGR